MDTLSGTGSPAIEIRGLSKSYGRSRGIENLNLTVPRGSIYGCIGPNGSGKTTTIRILLNLVKADSGTVRILNQDPARGAPDLNQFLGYLPGELGLPDSMTAAEALQFYGGLSGGHTPLQSWALEMLQLDPSSMKGPLRFFSKGMKQKVGLVQAIQHAPSLLILDEPTSGLDPVIQARLFHGLRMLRDTGVTIFLSSHILSEVQALCDRVAILREGNLILDGPISEILETGRRRLSIRRAGVHALVPPDIPGAHLEAPDQVRESPDLWWNYRTTAAATPDILAALTRIQPEDFRLESLLEESFLELYGLGTGSGSN